MFLYLGTNLLHRSINISLAIKEICTSKCPFQNGTYFYINKYSQTAEHTFKAHFDKRLSQTRAVCKLGPDKSCELPGSLASLVVR